MRTIKIALFVLLPVLIGIIACLVLLPGIIKKYANDHGKEYVGRKISIQEIKIDYFSSTFSLCGFKLFEADSQKTFVSFDTLFIKISPLPLFSSKLEVEQLRLVGPVVNIVSKDSTYNFDDMLAFANSKPKADTTGKSSSEFQYFIKNIALERGKLMFEDKNVDHTTTLNDLSFFIPSIRFGQEEIKDSGIKFHLENGGAFEAKTSFNQKTGAYKADISVNKLDVSPYLPYIKNYLKLTGISGLAGGNFFLAGNTNHLDSLLFRGAGEVTGFSLTDLKDKKVLEVNKANIVLNDCYPLKYTFRIDQIQLSEPSLYVEMKDSTINLLNLMVESAEDTDPFTYFYQVNKLRIEKGRMDLRDNSYEEPFDYHLSDISLKLDSVSSTSSWVNAFASMRLNKKGKLQAELGINPSDPYELKVDYVINNFQLTDLNIYSKHFVGFPILLGNMYYKGKTVIKGKQLTSENKLIVRNAQLGKKSGGLMNLPLKLAIYLLKDINGDIILDLPLTGDLNNPTTKIGKLVWQTLKNLVVKVVASPFISLSKLLGVEQKEVKGMEFNYCDTTLNATHLRRIKLYAELEEKKPDMKIELVSFNDAGLERMEIAKNEAGKLFTTLTGANFEKDEKKFQAFLSEKMPSFSSKPDSAAIMLIGPNKTDSIQQVYSRLRIQKIESALRSINKSTTIKLSGSDKRDPGNVGSRPVIEFKCNVDEN
jgi:hypothetical protein